MQKLEPLGVKRSVENAHAGRITARSIKTCDKPHPNWVVERRKNDRYGGCRRLCCECRWLATGCNYQVDVAADEIRRLLGQSGVLIVGPAIFDRNILTFNVADLLEAPMKRREQGPRCFGRKAA